MATDTHEHVKQIFQVVCVVHDLDQTLENWKNMVEFDTSSIKLSTTPADAVCTYRGRQIQCPIRYARFDFGGVDMKLVEPLNKSGGDPYSDCLLEKGQGFHHLGLYTEAYDALLEQYSALGLHPVYEEASGQVHYLLYDFTAQTGMAVAPWAEMTGPCGPRDPAGKTL